MAESKRKLLLFSSGRLQGHDKYLQHGEIPIKILFDTNNVEKVLIIPYAKKNYDNVANTLASTFYSWSYKVESIHLANDPIEAVNNSQAILVSGGNTFVLLKTLYEKNLIDAIRKRVLIDGIPYIGISAGTNIATQSICTTNDMPILYPPSFEALNLIPFNINPHYVELANQFENTGAETRDIRINEFISFNRLPVLGLRNANYLKVFGDSVKLFGQGSSRLFKTNFDGVEYESGADLSFLLQKNKENSDDEV